MLLLLLASHSDMLDLVFPSKSNVASCRTYGLPLAPQGPRTYKSCWCGLLSLH